MGLRLRHCSAACSSRKMTRLAVGCESVSYLRLLKYSTSPNWETRRRISRDSLMFEGRGVMRRWTARPSVDRARDAICSCIFGCSGCPMGSNRLGCCACPSGVGVGALIMLRVRVWVGAIFGMHFHSRNKLTVDVVLMGDNSDCHWLS